VSAGIDGVSTTGGAVRGRRNNPRGTTSNEIPITRICVANLRPPKEANREGSVLIDAVGPTQRCAAGNGARFGTEILPSRAAEPLGSVFIAVRIDMATEDSRSVARDRGQAVKAAVTDNRSARRLGVVEVRSSESACSYDNRSVI